MEAAPGQRRSIRQAFFRIKSTPPSHLGLLRSKKNSLRGRFSFAPSDEDIHTAVERRLTELIGDAAGKLHTGRSRNDQVATDFRLWMLQAIPALDAALQDLQSALVEQAEAAGETIMPGYTHLAACPADLAGALVAESLLAAATRS